MQFMLLLLVFEPRARNEMAQPLDAMTLSFGGVTVGTKQGAGSSGNYISANAGRPVPENN